MQTERESNRRKITLHFRDMPPMTVTIPVEEEELYRKSVTLINGTVNKYADHYGIRKSDKEILYMAMVEITLKFEKEILRVDSIPVIDVLSKLSSEIDELLNTKK